MGLLGLLHAQQYPTVGASTRALELSCARGDLEVTQFTHSDIIQTIRRLRDYGEADEDRIKGYDNADEEHPDGLPMLLNQPAPAAELLLKARAKMHKRDEACT